MDRLTRPPNGPVGCCVQPAYPCQAVGTPADLNQSAGRRSASMGKMCYKERDFWFVKIEIMEPNLRKKYLLENEVTELSKTKRIESAIVKENKNGTYSLWLRLYEKKRMFYLASYRALDKEKEFVSADRLIKMIKKEITCLKVVELRLRKS